jgi:TPR repeat protein
MSFFKKLFGTKDRVKEIYTQYIAHSINYNSEDEMYERLDAIRSKLTNADLELILKESGAGNPEAMCLRAVSLIENWLPFRDTHKAAELFKRAAEAGCAAAQDTVAGFYLSGLPQLGFKQNPDEAIRFYRLAAGQGFGKSQSRLGSLFSEDPLTADEGIDWIKKAAEQGIWTGMYNLALAYERGEGVPKNRELALQWFKKAANQGFIAAKKAVEQLKRN